MLFQLPLLEYFNILTNININTIFVLIITIIISYGIYNFSSNLGSKIIKHIPTAGLIVGATNLGFNLNNLYDKSKKSGSSGGGNGGSKDDSSKDDKSKDDKSKDNKSTESTSEGVDNIIKQDSNSSNNA